MQTLGPGARTQRRPCPYAPTTVVSGTYPAAACAPCSDVLRRPILTPCCCICCTVRAVEYKTPGVSDSAAFHARHENGLGAQPRCLAAPGESRKAEAGESRKAEAGVAAAATTQLRLIATTVKRNSFCLYVSSCDIFIEYVAIRPLTGRHGELSVADCRH